MSIRVALTKPGPRELQGESINTGSFSAVKIATHVRLPLCGALVAAWIFVHDTVGSAPYAHIRVHILVMSFSTRTQITGNRTCRRKFSLARGVFFHSYLSHEMEVHTCGHQMTHALCCLPQCSQSFWQETQWNQPLCLTISVYYFATIFVKIYYFATILM